MTDQADIDKEQEQKFREWLEQQVPRLREDWKRIQRAPAPYRLSREVNQFSRL